MFIKPAYPPDAKFVPVKYRFRSPCRLRIDGVLHGFGIGETIDVMMPSPIYLVCTYEPWDKIMMADGRCIEVPDNYEEFDIRRA
jgi:hypothetical protein